MTIRYSLTRFEVVRTYLFAMPRSPRILFVALIVCAWPGLVHTAIKLSLSRALDAKDILYTLLWAVCIFFLLLAWVFFRAKTSERTLTISGEGICTEIGRIKANYPWARVKEIQDTGSYVVVVSRIGNAFFIPMRAFADSKGRLEFLDALHRYSNAQHGTI